MTSVKRTSQRGETLVSLMLGMLVAMVVALALVSTYKVTSRHSTMAGQDATADAQVSYALIRAGMAAQEAGYGLATAAIGKHITALSNASLTGVGGATLGGNLAGAGTTGNNAVVWVLKGSNAVQCAGLLFNNATDGSGGLYYLGPVNCTDASNIGNLTGLTWSSSRWVDRPANQSEAAYNQTQISFGVASQTCAPFGLTTSTGKVMFTVSTTNRSGATLQEQNCLLNFH